jgi:hypothetical protein
MILMCSSVKRSCQKSHVKPSPLFLKTSQSPSQTLAELADVAGKPAYLSLKMSETRCIRNPMLRSLICSSIKKGNQEPPCGSLSVFLKTSQSPSKTVVVVADVVCKRADLSLKFSGTQCTQNQISKSLMCSSVKKGSARASTWAPLCSLL